MCGIAGFVFPGIDKSAADQLVRRMTARISHRGPDAEGHFLDADHGVALGHRRLSIVDLSSTGAQPMDSASGRYTLVFNGEIYNYPALRAQFVAAGTAFRGTSDTEVFLALVERDGFDAALQQVHGMFGIALWDRQSRELVLARDRLGEKPVYVGVESRGIWFASELKARTDIGYRPPELCKSAVAQYLRFGYVPDPLTIYEQVVSIPAGCVVRLPHALIEQGEAALMPAIQAQLSAPRYWSAEAALEARTETGEAPEAYAERLHAVLSDTIRNEMVADVPVGCFLSGGIDSSLVTAIAQSLSERPIKTYTIGFDNPAYDESTFSQAIADHLGCDHHCRPVTGQHAFDCIDQLGDTFDQPFANSSALPSLLLAEYAGSEVKVCLTGDGADEVFGGYNRYLFPPSIRRWQSSAWRWPIGAGLRLASGPLRGLVATVARSLRTMQGIENKLTKLAHSFAIESEHAMFESLISIFDAESDVMGERGPDWHAAYHEPLLDRSLDFIDAARLFDIKAYLACENLPKVDRTAMASALETRSPFLDHAVVECGLDASPNLLVSPGRGKLPLRALLDRYVPRELIERPKMGFSVPIDDWLDGDLKPMLDELLDPSLVRARGLFDPQAVARLRDAHTQKQLNSGARLWALLMFQQWVERTGSRHSTGPALEAAFS